MVSPKVALQVYDPLIPEELSKVFFKAGQGTQLPATPVTLPSFTPTSPDPRRFPNTFLQEWFPMVGFLWEVSYGS